MSKKEKVSTKGGSAYSGKKATRTKTGPYKTKAAVGVKESFGFRMMQVRRQKEWTQAQLAAASGFDVRVISRYENDGATPSIEAAARIARALGVSLDVLGGITASPAPVDAQLHALMQQCLALPQEQTNALKRLLKAWLRQE